MKYKFERRCSIKYYFDISKKRYYFTSYAPNCVNNIQHIEWVKHVFTAWPVKRDSIFCSLFVWYVRKELIEMDLFICQAHCNLQNMLEMAHSWMSFTVSVRKIATIKAVFFFGIN